MSRPIKLTPLASPVHYRLASRHHIGFTAHPCIAHDNPCTTAGRADTTSAALLICAQLHLCVGLLL